MNGVLDQRRPDPLPPEFRLDEQAVEFGRAVLVEDHGEAGDAAVDLGNHDLAALNLFGGKGDRIGMSEQGVAILVELQRRPTLQVLERGKLLGPREAEEQVSAP